MAAAASSAAAGGSAAECGERGRRPAADAGLGSGDEADGGAPSAADGEGSSSAGDDALFQSLFERAGNDSFYDTIAAIQSDREKLAKESRDLTRQLRNARRVRARLKKKARSLSDDDLLQLLRMKQGKAKDGGRADVEEPPAGQAMEAAASGQPRAA